MLIRKPSQKTF